MKETLSREREREREERKSVFFALSSRVSIQGTLGVCKVWGTSNIVRRKGREAVIVERSGLIGEP